MNILIVPPNDLINNVLPNRLYHLARNWTRHHTLYLLRYPYYPTSIDIERSLERIDVVPEAKSSSNPGTYYIKNAKAIYEALEKVLEKEPIDVVVHANILPSLFAVRLAKRLRIKTVFDYLDHYPESASAYYKNNLVKWAVRTVVSLMTKYNLRNSSEIVTVSYTLKQALEKVMKKPIHIIPNGVDTQFFRPLAKDFARKELALDQYNPILLYYGSIAEWVDYNVLIELTARLKAKYPRVLLLLIGKIYSHVEELEIAEKIKYLNIEGNIKILPPQPHDKIPVYIASADIVYAPFKDTQMNYGTPVKIFEALSCMKPVIATKLGEFKLWFKDFLFYYRDIEDLEKTTLQLLNNYEHYKDLLVKARNYVVENFDWRVLAEKYEGLFV